MFISKSFHQLKLRTFMEQTRDQQGMCMHVPFITWESCLPVACFVNSNILVPRPGFTYLEASDVPKGSFTIVAITYKEVTGKAAPFFITMSCDNVFNFDAIP